jgi:hypothetical protein
MKEERRRHKTQKRIATKGKAEEEKAEDRKT